MLVKIKPECKKGFVFPSMKLRCLDMTDESLAALGDEGYCENQVLPQTQFYSVSVLQPNFIVKSVVFLQTCNQGLRQLFKTVPLA